MTSKRLSNTIIIASGKGGVGKTWFSINLAHALGNQNKRVLLFDGDLGLANVNHQLGLKLKRDLGHVLKKKCAFEEAILTYKPNQYASTQMDIIASHTTDESFTPISKASVLSLKDSLTKIAPQYDHMVLDLSAGLDQIIQEFSTFAEKCLVVVTDEAASLMDALAFMRVTSQRNPDLPLHIVVNMAKSGRHGKNTYMNLVEACQPFLNKRPSLAGIIHQDHCVSESILKKISTLTSHPTSQAAQEIERIATEMAAQLP